MKKILKKLLRLERTSREKLDELFMAELEKKVVVQVGTYTPRTKRGA